MRFFSIFFRIGCVLVSAQLFSLTLFAESRYSVMAETIIINGKIFTGMDNPVWVEALAIQEEKINAIGTNQEISSLKGPETRVIDLKGQLVLPGFNDAHLHMADGGFYLLGIDLRPAKDPHDFSQLIKTYSDTLPVGAWITDGNWDHENWPVKKFPHKSLIDSITPNHPVLVQRLDGHIALANSLALKLAGVDKNTPNPQGGEIEHDELTGELTGILKDNAIYLVSRVIPTTTMARRREALETAIQHALSLGVTSIQDNTSRDDFIIYQQLRRENKLPIRINAWMSVDKWETISQIGISAPFGDDYLRLGTIKLFADGSLGAGTALFFEPYDDDPSTRGIPIYSMEELTELVLRIDSSGFQIACHAIGDQAVHWLLNAYEKAQTTNPWRTNRRHRIEHAQSVTAADLPRFRDLGVIASIQPSHAIDDMRWAEKRIGERHWEAYRCASFFKAGVHLAFGTDWFVEPLNPLLGIYAAVTREAPEGGPVGGWHPQEKLSLEQAIRAYTQGPAYAEMQEYHKGTLVPGQLADLIVLDHDIFKTHPQQWLETKVVLTMVGGRVVYQAP